MKGTRINMKKYIVTLVVLMFAFAGAFCVDNNFTPIIGVKNGHYVIERVEEGSGKKSVDIIGARYITAKGVVYSYIKGKWCNNCDNTSINPDDCFRNVKEINNGIIKKQTIWENNGINSDIIITMDYLVDPIIIPFGSDVIDDIRYGTLCLYCTEGYVILLQLDSALINYDSSFYQDDDKDLIPKSSVKQTVFESLINNSADTDAFEDFAYVIAASIKRDTDLKKLFYNPKDAYKDNDNYIQLYLNYIFNRGKQSVLKSFFDTNVNTFSLTSKDIVEAASHYEVPKGTAKENISKVNTVFFNTVLKNVNGVGELEKITYIVPAGQPFQGGDLLVFYDGDDTKIAVAFNANDAWIIDKHFWGTLYKNDKSISDLIDDGYIVRRLIQSGDSNTGFYDFVDCKIDNIDVTIGKMYEQGQSSHDELWRFIPNTGEYLVLDDIQLKITNKAGTDLGAVYGDMFNITVDAVDRDYSSEEDKKNQGNIWCNKANEFEFSYLNQGNKVVDSTSLKQLDNSDSYKAGTLSNRSTIKLNQNGELIIDNGEVLKIGIRPTSSATAYPGDDLLVNFNAELKTRDTSGRERSHSKISKTVDEKNYIAVYDKKMLWRANLYIEETDENVTDWNNAHPWNAPADSTADIKGTWADTNDKDYLENWNAVSWGYNEWNRVYKNSYTANLGIYQKFEDLPAGDGRQVVEITNTKWYYGMSHSVSETSFVRGYDKAYQKSVENRVAYDYWGWDSPFSFRKKIQEQLKISGLDEIPDYNNMTFPLRYGFLMADGKPTVVYSKRDEEGNITFYPKFFDTYTTVDAANNPQPPEGSGVKRSALVTKDGITLHPYIPGMSDQLSYKVGDNEIHINVETSDMVAGTDCNGLLQSSVSYSGCTYKALNGHFVKPVFWDNEEHVINESVMSRFVNRDSSNNYQQFSGDAVTAYLIGGRDNTEGKKKNDGTVVVDESQIPVKVYTFFRHLVPGDVIVYFTAAGQPAHIMMVSSIDNSDNETDDTVNPMYWNDGSSVHIIESVYNSGFEGEEGTALFGCGKNRNCEILKRKGKNWSIWRLE